MRSPGRACSGTKTPPSPGASYPADTRLTELCQETELLTEFLLSTLESLLEKLPHEQDERPTRKVGVDQLAQLARMEVEAYRSVMPGIGTTVTVRDDISTMMVSSALLI